jgi:hypothetical protein
MATTKRKRRKQRATLTDAQLWALLIGHEGAFTSDDEIRRAWFQNREYLLTMVNTLARPLGYWLFEVPEADWPKWSEGEHEYETLERMNLLRPDEIQMLADCRKKWPAMYPPRPIDEPKGDLTHA